MRFPLRPVHIAAVVATVCFLQSPANTQEAGPDRSLFKHVQHLGWVVKDLDAVVTYWEKLGLKNVRRAGVTELTDVTWRGRKAPVKLNQAFVDIGDVTIQWIQPMGGENVYTEFLSKHGDGVQHVAYAVPNEARLREQVAAFRAKGVDAVQQGSWEGQRGRGVFAYLDTAPRGGGMTIELVHNPDAASSPNGAQDPPFTRITQYAFVVRDVTKVSDFYESIGLGPLPFDRNISTDRMYRGRSTPFEMYLGWGRQGDVPFEWIQSLVGPNVYEEHLAARGEGFHHLGFNVRDLDAAIALMKERGAAITQSGGWDQPNSRGRFAYFDTDRVGGVTTELLWNKP